MKLLAMEIGGSQIFDTVVSKHLSAKMNPQSAETIAQRVSQLFTPIYTFIRIPYDMAYTVVDILQYNSNVWHLPEAQLKRKINGAHTDAISIQSVKDLKKLCKCSFGSVVQAAYTGALRYVLK